MEQKLTTDSNQALKRKRKGFSTDKRLDVEGKQKKPGPLSLVSSRPDFCASAPR